MRQIETAVSAVAVAPQSMQSNRMRPKAVDRSSKCAIGLTRRLQESAKRAKCHSAAEDTTALNRIDRPIGIAITRAIGPRHGLMARASTNVRVFDPIGKNEKRRPHLAAVSLHSDFQELRAYPAGGVSMRCARTTVRSR